jgi:ABC-type glycerol-3-phosphate transport system substrate-binding protein
MTDKEKNQYGLHGATSAPPYWSCAFIHGNGGTVLNDDYNKCTLTEPAAVEAVNWLWERMFTDEVMPTPASLTGQEDPFLSGKIGMAFNGTWYESQVRDADLFDWDFVPMPKHPITGKKSVQLGSNAWSIIANSKHLEEAWQFVKFMMGVDGQTWMMKYGVPGIKSVAESQAYKDLHAPQNIQIVVDDFACCGHDYYPTADTDEWWNVCGQEWGAIWSGELGVEEALTNACVAIDEVFSRRPANYER